MKIYNNAKGMTALHCDEDCQKRLEIALKSEERTPFILGREVERVDAGEEILLRCHLYLGLGNSTEKEIRWWHNSSLLNDREIKERNIEVEEEILLDVIQESRLIVANATFDDAGDYKCSNKEDRIVRKSFEVHMKVFKRE